MRVMGRMGRMGRMGNDLQRIQNGFVVVPSVSDGLPVLPVLPVFSDYENR